MAADPEQVWLALTGETEQMTTCSGSEFCDLLKNQEDERFHSTWLFYMLAHSSSSPSQC